jgi:hypothetical protein
LPTTSIKEGFGRAAELEQKETPALSGGTLTWTMRTARSSFLNERMVLARVPAVRLVTAGGDTNGYPSSKG